jgi:hypothetical protein
MEAARLTQTSMLPRFAGASRTTRTSPVTLAYFSDFTESAEKPGAHANDLTCVVVYRLRGFRGCMAVQYEPQPRLITLLFGLKNASSATNKARHR